MSLILNVNCNTTWLIDFNIVLILCCCCSVYFTDYTYLLLLFRVCRVLSVCLKLRVLFCDVFDSIRQEWPCPVSCDLFDYFSITVIPLANNSRARHEPPYRFWFSQKIKTIKGTPYFVTFVFKYLHSLAKSWVVFKILNSNGIM